jgi:gamma-glutamyltranspeptidase / glutathione hydrolase
MWSKLPAVVALGIVAVVSPACAPTAESNGPPLSPAGMPAQSANGVVVSGSPLATTVGVRVLEEGGNAVDAAVATAFALAVVEPTMSSIGGRTQIVLRAADGTVAAIDGTTEVPSAYTGGPVDEESAYGYETIAVPGTVAALATALRDHGTWPLDRVMQPAIELAMNGFALPEPEARRIASSADRLSEFASSKSYFLKSDGSAYAPDELFVQADLARTLQAIAAGGEDAFYRGEIGRRMAQDLQANGSLVTLADIEAYRAEPSMVMHGHYRGYELIGSYLPASGATSIEILQILDRFELAGKVGSAEWMSLVARALLAGFEDREADITPAADKAAWLTSTERAQQRARMIAGDSATTTGASIHEPQFTTHLSVADRNGGVVALTQSVGPLLGSRVAATGLGFLYAATMRYLGELEPDTRRHWSSQSPLLVLDGEQPILVLGGAGARRILSGIVETVSRRIDQGLPLEEALAAPRLHPTPDRIDAEVRTGTAWSDAVLDTLRGWGFNVRARGDAPWFARVNTIAWDAQHREWVGVADPRWDGAAGAARR